MYLENASSHAVEGIDANGKFNVVSGQKYSIMILDGQLQRHDHAYGFGSGITFR